MHYTGLYAPSSADGFCHQAIEQGLSWEQIVELCQKRSTMLSQWVPDSMEEVTRRSQDYDHLVAMAEWHSSAPRL